MKKNPRTGSSLEDFLKEEGIYERSTAVALKRVLVYELEQEMKRRRLSKSKVATAMKTSRAQLARIFDPQETGVTLETMQKAATAVGRELRLVLV